MKSVKWLIVSLLTLFFISVGLIFRSKLFQKNRVSLEPTSINDSQFITPHSLKNITEEKISDETKQRLVSEVNIYPTSINPKEAVIQSGNALNFINHTEEIIKIISMSDSLSWGIARIRPGGNLSLSLNKQGDFLYVVQGEETQLELLGSITIN